MAEGDVSTAVSSAVSTTTDSKWFSAFDAETQQYVTSRGLADKDPKDAFLEAANDLYANPWQVFRRVTLPLLWPAVLSGSVLAFVVSLDDFIMTFFVAGPGSTTLPVYIFSAIKAGVTPEINAISTLMLVISIVLVVLAFWLGQRGKQQ